MTTTVSLREQAYQHIRQKILVGHFPVNYRLSEVQLAKEIGISRTPVREAVSQLASEGLVQRHPELGVLVRQITRKELEELTNLRWLLESYAVVRAARRATEHDVAQLRGLVDRLRAISRGIRDAGLQTWNQELGRQLAITDILFHMTIMRTADSPRIMKIVDDFHVLTTRYRHPARQSLPILAEVLLEHWRIYRAIRRHDPKAARAAMKMQTKRWRKATLALYDQQEKETHTTPTVTDWSAMLERMLAAAPAVAPVKRVQPQARKSLSGPRTQIRRPAGR
jgi:DNA-binding GntR family transcriptional regulator